MLSSLRSKIGNKNTLTLKLSRSSSQVVGLASLTVNSQLPTVNDIIDKIKKLREEKVDLMAEEA